MLGIITSSELPLAIYPTANIKQTLYNEKKLVNSYTKL